MRRPAGPALAAADEAGVSSAMALEVHAVLFMFPGVVGPVDLVAVDVDQGAVDDHDGRTMHEVVRRG